MDADRLLSADGIEERAEYYSKWGADIRAMNGTSVDADHSEQTAFVLRALLANSQSLTRELEGAKALVAFALDRLENTDDAGPRDEGWQSAALVEWIAKARDLSRAVCGEDER